MLPQVSRTFALCIRLLPPDLQRSVMVAYLLCRIADTIEDAENLPAADKRALLQRFSDNLGAPEEDVGYLRAAFSGDGTAEDDLCHHADRVLRSFGRLDRDEQEAVRPWVEEMCAGMVEFSREPVATGTEMPSLERIEDLFIPRELCEQEGISVDELFGPDNADASRRVFDVLIGKASSHLQDALHYTTLFPATQYRIRLFCLTSLYFAIRTLSLAAADDGGLVEGATVKITRGEVYRILATTYVVAPSNRMVRWYFRRLGGDKFTQLSP